MRVLVTVSPRLYRESVAFSMRRGRPDLEVGAAPPKEAELAFYEGVAANAPRSEDGH